MAASHGGITMEILLLLVLLVVLAIASIRWGTDSRRDDKPLGG